jgi:hypothetical protein
VKTTRGKEKSVRRMLMLVIPGLVVLLAAGGSLAGTNSGSTKAGGISPARVIHFYPTGPGESCDGDSCGVGVLQPIPFVFRGAGTRYQATVTLSFQYRTSARGAFDAEVGVRDPSGHRLAILPAKRVLAARTVGDSTSIEFLVNGLRPGVRYDLYISALIDRRAGRRNSIETSNLLVVVEASAA